MIEDVVLAVKRLASADPHDLADDETIVALHRLKAQLDAVSARATAAWEARRGFADEHRTAVAWLSARCHVAPGEAAEEVRRGRACRVLPVAEQAWLDGDITGRHVSRLADARTERTADRLAADEADLVGEATRRTFRGFARIVAYWEQVNDDDDAEDEAQRLADGRSVHLSETFQGAWRLDGDLDPIGGSIVARVLRAIENELFEVDWAEARARLGDRITVADLARTPAQRRADALVEMATRAATAPRDGRRPAPLFTVLVDFETFSGRVCELANRTVVSPGSLVPWLTEADIERVVFSSPTRVECSATSRLFTGATRRAVQVRDQECAVTGCDEPAEAGHVDHIVPYADGGETTQVNGRVLCRFHNLLRNRRPGAP